MCAEIYNLLLRMEILNIGPIFIKLNVMYVIYNICRTHLLCDRTIGATLTYNKRTLIWVFVFLRRFIIEHYFITKFLVIVYSYSIFNGVIFINLRLIFMA